MSIKSLAGPNPAPAPSQRIVLTLLLALLLCAASVGVATAGKWKGKTIDEGGVPHMVNPAEGMEKARSIQLEELWRLGGDSDDEDEFFGIVSRVLIDETGNVYLLDSQLSEIKIYDAAGGYLNTIGREGEGPGEFRGAAGMFWLPGGAIGVLQAAPGKIVMLTPEGDPAGEHPLPSAEGAGFVMLVGGNSNGKLVDLVIGVNSFEEGKFTQTRSLINVNSQGEAAVTYASSDRTMDFSNAIISEKVWDGFENRWAMANDGRVYANEAWGEYSITRWAPDGTKEMIIERQMNHRKRDETEIKRIEGIYSAFTRQVPNAKVEINDLDQDVFRMYSRDDGTLWVNTSYGAIDLEEGTVGVFDIYNDQGQYVREVTLKGEGHPRTDGYFFVKDRLFVVTGLLDAVMAAQGGGTGDENLEEAKPMSVICYKLDLKI